MSRSGPGWATALRLLRTHEPRVATTCRAGTLVPRDPGLLSTLGRWPPTRPGWREIGRSRGPAGRAGSRPGRGARCRRELRAGRRRARSPAVLWTVSSTVLGSMHRLGEPHVRRTHGPLVAGPRAARVRAGSTCRGRWLVESPWPWPSRRAGGSGSRHPTPRHAPRPWPSGARTTPAGGRTGSGGGLLRRIGAAGRPRVRAADRCCDRPRRARRRRRPR